MRNVKRVGAKEVGRNRDDEERVEKNMMMIMMKMRPPLKRERLINRVNYNYIYKK